jgi:hypothetical protein
MLLMLILAPLLLAACQGRAVQYMDDSSFMTPSKANAAEVLVTVNGRPCLDVDGAPGLCALRIKSGEDLVIGLSGEPYAYQLTLTCSSGLQLNGQYSSPAGQVLRVTIPADKYGNLKSFTCIGEIFPQDRPEPSSSKFEFRAAVVSQAYVPREPVQVVERGDGRWYAEPGPYALYTLVKDSGVWRVYHRETSIHVSGPDVIVASESRECRMNLYRGTPAP